MSSSRGGKFQDHYAILEVDAKASQEDVLAAHSLQAAKYHPERGSSPDAAKYEAISLAREVLSDPSSRVAFDSLRGNPQQEGPHRFSGIAFFETVAQEPLRRIAILCLLYDRARQQPTRPGLSVRQTEAILNMTGDDMRFSLVYLKQRGLAMSDDKSNLLITVDGMDYVEKANPDPARILPLLTEQPVPGEPSEAVAPSEIPEESAPEPVAEMASAPRTVSAQSESLAARIRTRMAIPRSPAQVG